MTVGASNRPLSPFERQIIDQFGGIPTLSEQELAEAEYTRDHARLPLSLSLSVAAELLGVSQEKLLGFAHAKRIQILPERGETGGYLVPTWQIVGHQLLPNLDKILPELADRHPLEIAGFFEHAEIEEEERVFTPAEWLLSEGEPDRILDLFPGLRRPLV